MTLCFPPQPAEQEAEEEQMLHQTPRVLQRVPQVASLLGGPQVAAVCHPCYLPQVAGDRRIPQRGEGRGGQAERRREKG